MAQASASNLIISKTWSRSLASIGHSLTTAWAAFSKTQAGDILSTTFAILTLATVFLLCTLALMGIAKMLNFVGWV